MTLVKILLAIILPPVAVFMQAGLGVHFWLNLLLTIFFWLPGQVHAIWLIVVGK